MTFGERLKSMRKEKKMTQATLAEKSGISSNTIFSFESGRRKNPTSDTIFKLASALDVDPGELAAGWPGLKVIGGNNSETPEPEKTIPSIRLGELDMSSVENDQTFIRMAIAYSRLNEEAQEMAAGIVESIAQNPLCQKAENR